MTGTKTQDEIGVSPSKGPLPTLKLTRQPWVSAETMPSEQPNWPKRLQWAVLGLSALTLSIQLSYSLGQLHTRERLSNEILKGPSTTITLKELNIQLIAPKGLIIKKLSLAGGQKW